MMFHIKFGPPNLPDFSKTTIFPENQCFKTPKRKTCVCRYTFYGTKTPLFTQFFCSRMCSPIYQSGPPPLRCFFCIKLKLNHNVRWMPSCLEQIKVY